MIRMLGGLVGCQADAEQLADRLAARAWIDRAVGRADFRDGLRVVLRGMGRTADLGHPLGRGARRRSPAAIRSFRSSSTAGLAEDRIVDPAAGRADAIRKSCSRRGAERRCEKATIVERPGWDTCQRGALDDRIFEVKSTYILQPGPASLTEGVRQLHAHFARIHDIGWTGRLRPEKLATARTRIRRSRATAAGPPPARRRAACAPRSGRDRRNRA